MEADAHSLPRYRAKAARRPLLYWWQAFLLLAVLAFMWRQFPVSAVLFETRVFSPLPEPRASYVALDPAYAAQVFKKMRASWATERAGENASFELDLGFVDLNGAPPAPLFLEQGARYPGVWQPAPVTPLPLRLPEVATPAALSPAAELRWPEQQPGIRFDLDPALGASAFAFPMPDKALPVRSGSCRFQVETDADGAVAHLLLLSPRTEAAAVLEQALVRGKAKGAARGLVDFSWSFVK